MLHRLPVQRVQHRVARAVGRARAAVRLPALPVVERLPAKRALVDLAVLRAAVFRCSLVWLCLVVFDLCLVCVLRVWVWV